MVLQKIKWQIVNPIPMEEKEKKNTAQNNVF